MPARGIMILFSSLVVLYLSGCSSDSTTDDTAYSVSATTSLEPSTGVDTTSMYDIPLLDSETITRYVTVINSYRTQEGGQDCGDEGHFNPVPPLAWNDALYKAAYEHTYDMVMNDFVSHDGSGTEYDWTAAVNDLAYSTVADRVEQNGYTGWVAVGENIAAGTSTDTVEKALEQLMASPGHCANIMSPDYKEVGMAHLYSDTTTYGHYWTQVFGARP